jgi:hypothetical protein
MHQEIFSGKNPFDEVGPSVGVGSMYESIFPCLYSPPLGSVIPVDRNVASLLNRTVESPSWRIVPIQIVLLLSRSALSDLLCFHFQCQ